MPSASAMSVPGRIGIQRSALAAVADMRGSTQTIGAPFRTRQSWISPKYTGRVSAMLSPTNR